MNEPEPEQELRRRVASRQHPDETKRIGMAAALERYYQAMNARRPGRRIGVDRHPAPNATDPGAAPAE